MNAYQKIANALKIATEMPADGTVAELDGILVCHLPGTSMKVEQVRVRFNSRTYRRRLVRGSWAKTEEIEADIC